MPCDIGYKTYAPIRIPQPKPQTFKKKMPSPSIDQDLLEKLGVDDPEFLAWAKELSIKPLLEEALRRALAVKPTGKVNFSISESGNIVAESTYLNNSEKRGVENTTNQVANLWQMEVLKIITQLLGYDANIQAQKAGNGENLVLVAEEKGKTHPCKYIRVSKDQNGNGEITFEHFDSKSELEKEKVKFAALAQKMGIKIHLPNSPISGKPIPGSIEEKHQHEHAHEHGHFHVHQERE